MEYLLQNQGPIIYSYTTRNVIEGECFVIRGFGGGTVTGGEVLTTTNGYAIRSVVVEKSHHVGELVVSDHGGETYSNYFESGNPNNATECRSSPSNGCTYHYQANSAGFDRYHFDIVYTATGANIPIWNFTTTVSSNATAFCTLRQQ